MRSDADRKLIVAGHTDNQGIREANFKNSWELSAARAVTVTELLVTNGLRPKNLVAAGFGEFHPIADNRTAKGRQDNRRIEIEIQPPDLEALPKIVQAVSSAAVAPADSAPPAASASSSGLSLRAATVGTHVPPGRCPPPHF